jgi:hypothetical protein
MKQAVVLCSLFLCLACAAQDAVEESSSKPAVVAGPSTAAADEGGAEAPAPPSAATSAAAQSAANDAASAPLAGDAAPNGSAESIAVSAPVVRETPRRDFNRDIYYRNKLEFSLETGWLPVNIPFPFDFLVGDSYENPFRYYTLAPALATVRWHVSDINGPSFLRGNTELNFSGAATLIPKSSGHVEWTQKENAESRYFAFILGVRRNFVPRNSRVAPYFDFRLGIGHINAKGPLGMRAAQGQDMTFTIMMGSGFRYNFSPRVSASMGVAYMHVSNAYLSEPAFEDYGINVYGPMVSLNIRLGKAKRSDGSVY